jgi:hypothetical protein
MPSHRFGRALARAYATIDPRSLAAGRIALALVLLLDLAKRAAELGLWYSNEGLLPNHTLLWRPTHRWVFSFFYMASSPGEAALGMLVCALAYLALLIGYRTRFAHLASFLCMLSLHGRVLFVQNGGDVVLGELCLWTMFLPTGRRWSMDATLARLRASAEADAVGLAPDDPARTPANDTRPVVSLAVLALLVQLSVIYLFNAIHKSGVTWREGSAVYYVLNQARIATRLAVWARQHMTLTHSRLLTWSALVMESTLPLLILSPILTRWTRRLAVLLIWALHIGFAVFLNLGVFVPAMLAFTPNLLSAQDWDLLGRWAARRGGPGVVLSAARRAWLSVARVLLRLERPGPPAPLAHLLRSRLAYLREALVVAAIVVAANQLLVENGSIRRLIRFRQPEPLLAAMTYLQLFQGWAMFAPDTPTSDLNLYVDAVTADGRHVDPFNAVASPGAPAPGPRIPERLDQNSFFCDYLTRLPGHGELHGAFTDWIKRYSERTGRPEDRIVSFEAFVVEHDSPPPGDHTPRNVRTRSFLRYP